MEYRIEWGKTHDEQKVAIYARPEQFKRVAEFLADAEEDGLLGTINIQNFRDGQMLYDLNGKDFGTVHREAFTMFQIRVVD